MKNPYQFQIQPLPMTPFDWIAIDVETGGLDPTRHRLLSVGFWSPSFSDSFYVRDSDGSCEPEAMAINRINLADLSTKGISRDEARQRFLDAVRGRAVVGQNVSFDLAFIASRLFGLRPGDRALELFNMLNIHDTRRQFEQLHPGAPARLADIARFYEITFTAEDCHECSFDARLTGEVLIEESLEVRGL